jgi:hypothetical protein
VTLEDQIAERAREIKTDGYAMSIGEVLSLYRDGDIEIHPEFQRIFRWTPEQKSRLIESILLGIPIPPIFVSQRADGVWDVIDGVQRLSTVLEFLGEYRDEDRNLLSPAVLTTTEYLPGLDGFTWEVGPDPAYVFSDALRRDFKRAKFEFRIIRKESDSNAKYDLFQRLNSGAQLSAQEARNCLLVMMNVDLFNKVSELAGDPDFNTCVPLSDRQEDRAYRQELVLRFFAQADFTGGNTQLTKEYGDYLTSWMRSAAEREADGQLVVDPSLFHRTFHTLRVALDDGAFRRWDSSRAAHLGPFSISSYEFITAGLAAHIDTWEPLPDALRDRVRAIWTAAPFRDNSGTGVSPRRRVPRIINEARAFFASA